MGGILDLVLARQRLVRQRLYLLCLLLVELLSIVSRHTVRRVIQRVSCIEFAVYVVVELSQTPEDDIGSAGATRFWRMC